MRVFVLSTGRCGSTTLARACGHLTNFTSGHETRAALAGPERFDYPDQHVESDNRLSWFLPGLARSVDAEDTTYVHLVRDPDLVAASYARRWDSPFRPSLMRAFGHGLVMRKEDWPAEERHRVARFLVDSVNDTIASFVAAQPHVVRGDIADADAWFPGLWDRIGGEGDLDAARQELAVRYNASRHRAT